MELLSILILHSMLLMSDCVKIVEADMEEITTTISNLIPVRQKLPIFPKRNVKFIYRPHSPQDSNKEEIVTRKSLMVKMVTKYELNHIAKLTEPATRRPLMKIKNYTVKMRSKVKEHAQDEKHGEDRGHSKRSSSQFNHAKKSYIQRNHDKELTNEHISNKIAEKSISTDILQSPPEKNIMGKFSKEEEQDRNEFIFLQKYNEDFVVHDLLYMDEDSETTTSNPIERKIRHMRSSNIIEEENMGTTISALKYTGRDTRLTNELHFKNINH